MNAQQYEGFNLQFITHHNDRYDYLQSAQQALQGGCKWIQLRMKGAPVDEVEEIALQLMPLCREQGAVFILDDHVGLCKKIGGDGVHLGKKDMLPAEARQQLGTGFIIGGTCNTFEDVMQVKDSVDYIGCGPFRFTTTKQGLAPVLGLDGYRNIVWQCRSNGINLPMVAIGGITRQDIPDVLNAGPNGVAVSGAILNAPDPVEETRQMLEIINANPFRTLLDSLPDCGL